MRVLVLAAASFLAGCTQPAVTPQAPNSQLKVTSLDTWQHIANSQASKLSKGPQKHVQKKRPVELTQKLGNPSSNSQYYNKSNGYIDPTQPVYVQQVSSDWPFGQAYRKYLIEALLQRGYSVARNPDGATVINFGVDTYLYGHSGVRGGNKTLIDYPSFWGGLAAAGFEIEDATLTAAQSARLAAGSGIVLQALKQITDTTNAEAVLTTKIISEDRVLFTSTENFYVKPEDLPLYWSRLPDQQPKPSGGKPGKDPDVMQIRLTN